MDVWEVTLGKLAWVAFGLMLSGWLLLVVMTVYEVWLWLADPVEARVADRRSRDQLGDGGPRVVNEVLAEGYLGTVAFSTWTRVHTWPGDTVRIRGRLVRRRPRIRATPIQAITLAGVVAVTSPVCVFVLTEVLDRGSAISSPFAFDQPFDSMAAFRPGALPQEGPWRDHVERTLLGMPGVTAVWFLGQEEAYMELLRMHRGNEVAYERTVAEGVKRAIPSIRLQTDFSNNAEKEAVRTYLWNLPGVLDTILKGDRR